MVIKRKNVGAKNMCGNIKLQFETKHSYSVLPYSLKSAVRAQKMDI